MILFCHLLNDRTGSPRVLKSVIEGLEHNDECILYIGSSGKGLLSKVSIPIVRYWYRRSKVRLLTLFTYFLSQALLLCRLLAARDIPQHAVVYVNTLLPIGAAIYGLLTKRRVVYHIHEISLSPRLFQRFVVAIARLSATRFIYVSDAHRTLLPIDQARSVTIYNPLDHDLALRAASHPYTHRHHGTFIVLMLASDRPYKGIGEFRRLAASLKHRTDIVFRLVLSDRQDGETDDLTPSVELQIWPPVDNPADYYEKASVVLNLSRPDQWIETFGLTLLEAMAFGVPVIAPPCGGPLELVTDGQEGFLIDSRNDTALTAAVERMADDEQLMLQLSQAARTRSRSFTSDRFVSAIIQTMAAAHG